MKETCWKLRGKHTDWKPKTAENMKHKGNQVSAIEGNTTEFRQNHQESNVQTHL